MNEFEYLRPTNVGETLTILSSFGGKAKVLAGGTDLVLLLQQGQVKPSHVIDISNIPELNYIREENGYLKIGASTRMRDIETSKIVKTKIPMLADAVCHLKLELD